jgi:hypothetical protein
VLILISLLISLAAVTVIAPEDVTKSGCGGYLQSLVDSHMPGRRYFSVANGGFDTKFGISIAIPIVSGARPCCGVRPLPS